MVTNIKAFIVILFLSFIAFHFAKKVTADLISDKQFKQWKISWLLLTSFAFLSFNYWIYSALVLIYTSYKTKKETYPIAFYIALLFTAPPIPATLSAGGVYLLQFDYLMILSAGILLKLHLNKAASNSNLSFGKVKTDLFIIGFILVYIALATSDTTFTDALRQGVVLVFSTFLPYYVVSRHVKTTSHLNAIFAAFTFAFFPIALISVFESLKHWLLYASLSSVFGLNWGLGGYLMRAGALRASASTGHSLTLGFCLLISIGCFLFVKEYIKIKKYRLIGMVIIIAGFIASLARGSWISAIVLMTVYIYLGRSAVPNLFKFATASVLSFALLSILPGGEKAINLIPFVGNVDTQNVSYRQELFNASISVVSKSPWFGNRKYKDEPEMKKMVQGEGIIDLVNVYLRILLTSGYVGLFVFVGIFLSALMPAYKAMRRIKLVNPRLHHIGRILVATFIAMMFNLATLSFQLSTPYLCYIFAGLCVAYTQIVKIELSSSVNTLSLR